MEWFTADTLGKVLIPAATFVLGVTVTLFTKRVEKRRAELKERVTAIAKLVNDWYNQVHELTVDAETRADTPEATKAVYFYVHNRLILPELMLHLEFMRKREAEPKLVSAVDDFLALVTKCRPPMRELSYQGADMLGMESGLQCKQIFTGRRSTALSEDTEAQELLSQLDAKLQEVTKLSAHALATKA